MEVHYERELQDIEKCLADFSYNLGMLRRGATVFLDPDAADVFGAFAIDLDNLATAARTFSLRCGTLRRAMYQKDEWNKAYREAYGMNHPDSGKS